MEGHVPRRPGHRARLHDQDHGPGQGVFRHGRRLHQEPGRHARGQRRRLDRLQPHPGGHAEGLRGRSARGRRRHAASDGILGDALRQLAAHGLVPVPGPRGRAAQHAPQPPQSGPVRPGPGLHPRGTEPVPGPDAPRRRVSAGPAGIHAVLLPPGEQVRRADARLHGGPGQAHRLRPRTLRLLGELLRTGLRRGGQDPRVRPDQRPAGQCPDGRQAAHGHHGGRGPRGHEHAHPQRAAHPPGPASGDAARDTRPCVTRSRRSSASSPPRHRAQPWSMPRHPRRPLWRARSRPSRPLPPPRSPGIPAPKFQRRQKLCSPIDIRPDKLDRRDARLQPQAGSGHGEPHERRQHRHRRHPPRARVPGGQARPLPLRDPRGRRPQAGAPARRLRPGQSALHDGHPGESVHHQGLVVHRTGRLPDRLGLSGPRRPRPDPGRLHQRLHRPLRGAHLRGPRRRQDQHPGDLPGRRLQPVLQLLAPGAACRTW